MADQPTACPECYGIPGKGKPCGKCNGTGKMTAVDPAADAMSRAMELVERFQAAGLSHPYTCGNADHDWRRDDAWTTLKPEPRDRDIWLVCPPCGYEQRLTTVDCMYIARADKWILPPAQ